MFAVAYESSAKTIHYLNTKSNPGPNSQPNPNTNSLLPVIFLSPF